MRQPDRLTTYILDQLSPLGPISARRMFGGVGLFHGGAMFGLIAREELFLKLTEATRAQYQAAGEAPFSYATKNGTNTIASYWRCPPDLLDDAVTLQTWARLSIGAARTAIQSKPRRPAKSPGRSPRSKSADQSRRTT